MEDRVQEKYHRAGAYWSAWARRVLLRAVLRWLARWRPLRDPEPGYTVIIGCLATMTRVLQVNLTLLQKQRRDNLREVIVVFDATEAQAAPEAARIAAQFPDLPLRFVFYSPTQVRVLGIINWAWCYSWLSWSLGIAACRTRYALLHDLDALLLREDMLEERYAAIRERGDEYLGVRFYRGNGIDRSDKLAVTFELMFDAQYVREHFHPIALFNHVGRCNGKRVEYDTFLHAQYRRGRASELATSSREMVHPSQLFCQWMELNRQRSYVPPAGNNLPLLPYLFHVAGDGEALATQREAFEQARDGSATLFGRPMDLARLSMEHVDWLTEQVERLEQAVAGQVRPEVRAYLESLRGVVARRAGGAQAPVATAAAENGNRG